jgi:hypothetical protein
MRRKQLRDFAKAGNTNGDSAIINSSFLMCGPATPPQANNATTREYGEKSFISSRLSMIQPCTGNSSDAALTIKFARANLASD